MPGTPGENRSPAASHGGLGAAAGFLTAALVVRRPERDDRPDPQVQVAPIGTFRPPNESATDTELFRIIEAAIRRHHPGVPVTTKMLSGATESVLVRPFGIVAYGFTPLLATPEEVATAHGDDERVREGTVRQSVAVFYEVVSELCRHRN